MATIEWMCTYCGKKILKMDITGRPAPGKCPRKTGDRPHTWIKHRKIGK